MTEYQVTARFARLGWQTVGKDSAGELEALKLFQIYKNTGRPVRLYKIVGDGSRMVKEANN